MMYKCKYFKIQELISKQVYDKYGEERCWQFFDDRALQTLDDLREHFGRQITINNWLWGGEFQQRGLRCNLDPLVANKTSKGKIYLSDHNFGRAFDFDVLGYTSEEARQFILDNQDKFPYIKVLEGNVNWVHVGFRNSPYERIKIFYV